MLIDECWTCGKKGHFSKECWQKGKSKGKGMSGPNKGKGKGDKGKGKGMRTCYNCGKEGSHIAKYCWAPKAKGKGKGKSPGKGTYAVWNAWGENDTWTNQPESEVETKDSDEEEAEAKDGQLCEITRTEPRWEIIPTKKAAKWNRQAKEEEKQQRKVSHFTEQFGKETEKTVKWKEEETEELIWKEKVSYFTEQTKTKEKRIQAVEEKEKKGDYSVIEFAVDSGASETVLSSKMLKTIPVTTGVAKNRGVTYETANGDVLPNEGENKFRIISERGSVKKVTAQVTEVKRPLLSVSKCVKAGHTFVFKKEGSYMEDGATKEKPWLVEKKWTYRLQMWVPKNQRVF